MLDAVLITSQPYNSSNTLANSVGYAMWNNVLYNKVGTLWKITSSGANYNPCSVDSAYDSTDYTNLRCVNNYTYDSGWQYNGGWYSCTGWGACNFTSAFNCTVNSSNYCTIGNSVIYKGSSAYCGDGYCNYYVKKIDNLTEYKLFSSF